MSISRKNDRTVKSDFMLFDIVALTFQISGVLSTEEQVEFVWLYSV